MLFDTSSVELALESLLAFKYPGVDISPLLMTPLPLNRVTRAEGLATLLRDFERTIVAVACSSSGSHGVPTELLQEIFRAVIVNNDSSQARIALSHVSSRWRSVSLALPELWTEIHHSISYRTDMFAEFMPRSGSLDLLISVDTSIPHANIPTTRVSSVTFRGYSTEEALTALIPTFPVLNLKHMSLRQDDNLGRLPVCWQMANLRSLRLCGVALTNGSTRIHCLEEIHISNINFTSLALTISEVGAQALSEIELSNITHSNDPHTDAYFALNLSVQHVQCLAIADCHANVFELLFRYSHMPNLRHLSLYPWAHLCMITALSLRHA